MPLLILTLPPEAPAPGAAAPEFDYILTDDDQALQTQGRAAAALLPAQVGRHSEVVLVLPVDSVSWHRLSLPSAVGRSALSGRMDSVRLRAVLSGALEEQLLDEPEHLYFAIFPGPEGAPDGSINVWVATCERARLQAGLQALDGAGRSASRIVAELTPLSEGLVQVSVCVGVAGTHMLLCSAQGVTLLPLLPAAVAFARAQGEADLLAEPPVHTLAEQTFGQRAALQTPVQRLLLAAQSPWNLAQGDFSPSHSSRLARRLHTGWQQLLRAPAWRPLRCGLVCALILQVVDLNALAWRDQDLLEQRRAAIRAILTQTFPDVPVVIDAPLQMQRAVDALALARGAASGPDLGQVLSEVGAQAPAVELTAMDLEQSTIRLHTGSLPEPVVAQLVAALAAQNWKAQFQDGVLSVQSREAD